MARQVGEKGRLDRQARQRWEKGIETGVKTYKTLI